MWLYFTRSNGDIDNTPNREDLKTATSRKAFIGDEASRFSVQDGVLNPVWDGSEYIKDVTNKEAEKEALKVIRDEALMACTVTLNGEEFQARENDLIRLESRVNRLAPGASGKWLTKGNKKSVSTKEDLQVFLSAGLEAIDAIWDTYIDAVDAL